MKTILLALLPIFAALACGGTVLDQGGGDGGAGSGSGGGGSSGGGGGGSSGGGGSGTRVGCPTSEPSSGGACSPEALSCEYGSNNGACGNSYMECDDGHWASPPPVPLPACLSNAICPATEAEITVGAACGDSDAECNFPQGRCTCQLQIAGPINVFPDGGEDHEPRKWQCEAPQIGCSAARPRIGSDCAQEGQECDYGSCMMLDSANLECDGGRWASKQVLCE